MNAQLIATHRRPALIAALLTLAVSLVACSPGVDVAVTGIPADTQVSCRGVSKTMSLFFHNPPKETVRCPEV